MFTKTGQSTVFDCPNYMLFVEELNFLCKRPF